MARSAVLALAVGAVVSGCSPDFRDGVGPVVPVPNVEGSVMRSGSAASGLDVSLRDSSGVETAKTVTSASGSYGFGDVAPGGWEVKVSGSMPGDFDSVTRDFALASPSVTLTSVDVSARGAAASDPANGASLPVPSAAQPLTFQWTFPSVAGATAHVQVFDSQGSPVWSSGSLKVGSSAWDGLGNQGTYQGKAAVPGSYTWRLKFSLPDSSQAKTAPWRLDLR